MVAVRRNFDALDDTIECGQLPGGPSVVVHELKVTRSRTEFGANYITAIWRHISSFEPGQKGLESRTIGPD
jgi:hypothetical protein